jgi:NADH-quinone oxidoreductase subunit M
MNLVMLGLFSYSQQGIEGAVYLMIGHGVVSTALFFSVGVLYDRYHSRLLRYYSGLVVVMPLFVAAFFCFTLANMSFPGTSNFVGELLVFFGICFDNTVTLIFASSSIVFSAIYSIWLFNRVSFGTLKTDHINRFSDLTRRETVIFGYLLFAMLFLGVSANFILEFLDVGVKDILLLATSKLTF